MSSRPDPHHITQRKEAPGLKSKAILERQQQFFARWLSVHRQLDSLAPVLTISEFRLMHALMNAAMRKESFAMRLKVSEVMEAGGLDDRSHPMAVKRLSEERHLLKTDGKVGKGFMRYVILNPQTQEPFSDTPDVVDLGWGLLILENG